MYNHWNVIPAETEYILKTFLYRIIYAEQLQENLHLIFEKLVGNVPASGAFLLAICPASIKEILIFWTNCGQKGDANIC